MGKASWVVSPNVRNHPKNSKRLETDVSKRADGVHGWHAGDFGHSQIEAKSASNAARGIVPGDVVLIARNHRLKPEMVGFRIVRGKYETRLRDISAPERFGSLRGPF